MYIPKITYKEIISGVNANNDPRRNRVVNFLREFVEYLRSVKHRGKPLSEASIKMYVNRLLSKFLNESYSLDDLLGSLDRLIFAYSRDGELFDKKDHNNTLSALKHLRNFHLHGILPKYISISISSGYQSFAVNNNHGDHLVFQLENNWVLVPKKQKISDYDYYKIQELIFNHIRYLSRNGTSIMTHHGPINYFNYVIGNSMNDFNALRGSTCSGLFYSDDPYEKQYVENLNKRFLSIISKYRQ